VKIIFYTFARLQKSTQYLVHLGLRILAALTFSFIFLGINPPRPAQAEDGGWYTFVPIVVPSADYVCTGETMTLSVSINRLLPPKPGDTKPNFDKISAVMVNAVVNDTNVGELTSNSAVIGWTRLKPDTAEFTYKAKDTPGRTKIDFKSSFSEFWTASQGMQSWFPTTVDRTAYVEVRNCTYKVNQIFVGYSPGIMSWAYSADETILGVESATHYTGSVPFHRIIKVLVHDRGLGPGIILCSKKPYRTGKITVTTEPTMIDYKADLTNGTLYFTMSVRKYKDTSLETCTGAAWSTDMFTFFNPTQATTLSFPPQGGVQVIRGPVGSTTVIVERVAVPVP
jgi:hypothetical protein